MITVQSCFYSLLVNYSSVGTIRLGYAANRQSIDQLLKAFVLLFVEIALTVNATDLIRNDL